MAHLIGEGHSIYILETPKYQALPERIPNVILSQNPGTGPCRAIPLEQLTKVERERKYNNRKQIKVLGTVTRGWSSDYLRPYNASSYNKKFPTRKRGKG